MTVKNPMDDVNNITQTDNLLKDIKEWYARVIEDLDHIDKLIETPRSSEPGKLVNELDELIQWSARAGEIQAQATSRYEVIYGTYAEEFSVQGFATSVANAMAKKKAGLFCELKVRAERKAASISHAIDAIRSMLSYQKKLLDIQAFNNQKGGR